MSERLVGADKPDPDESVKVLAETFNIGEREAMNVLNDCNNDLRMAVKLLRVKSLEMLINMDWTSLYLKTANLNVFILGTGEVATRRANKFLDHGANVKLAGDVLDKELINKGAVLASVDDVDKLVQWSELVVIASGDRELSDYVGKIAGDKLLNRADFPDNGNIIVPTSFNIGDVEISIFTNGKKVH